MGATIPDVAHARAAFARCRALGLPDVLEPGLLRSGRIVRTHARAGDELDWHDDLNGPVPRRLGITIGLGEAPYTGGLFEMCSHPDGQTLIEFKHDSPGTALVFKVSTRCEHRAHPLLSGGPRRLFTGWFVG